MVRYGLGLDRIWVEQHRSDPRARRFGGNWNKSSNFGSLWNKSSSFGSLWQGTMGCGGHICYCCSCRRSDASSAPRVEAVHHSSNGEKILNGNANGNGNGEVLKTDEGGNAKLVPLKSNLKKQSRFSEENGIGERYNTTPTPTPIDGITVTTSSVDAIATGDVTNSVDGNGVEDNTTKLVDGIRESVKPVDAIEEHSVEAEQEELHANGRRKVQWTDAHGQELVQVKEFEPSDSNHSDDEGRVNSDDSCTCVIQ